MTAQANLEKSRKMLEQPGEKYTSLRISVRAANGYGEKIAGDDSRRGPFARISTGHRTALARQPQKSINGSRRCQSHLAQALWSGVGRNRLRLWPAFWMQRSADLRLLPTRKTSFFAAVCTSLIRATNVEHSFRCLTMLTWSSVTVVVRALSLSRRWLWPTANWR